MARMLVIYKVPRNKEAFNKHYFGVHVPLAKKLPGLRKYDVSDGPIIPMNGAGESHLIAILHFDDMASLRTAFASEIGQACAADRKVLANDSEVQTFLFEGREL